MARQTLPQHENDCIECKLPEPNGLYHACMNCRNKAVAECRRLEAELERALAKITNDDRNLHLQSVVNLFCPKCGNTGRCEPRTLSDPDGQECDCWQT